MPRAARQSFVNSEDLKDTLAEMVAEGASLEYAGRALGLTTERTSELWDAVQLDLGIAQCV